MKESIEKEEEVKLKQIHVSYHHDLFNLKFIVCTTTKIIRSRARFDFHLVAGILIVKERVCEGRRRTDV